MLFILHPGKQYPVSIISQINKPIQFITIYYFISFSLVVESVYIADVNVWQINGIFSFTKIRVWLRVEVFMAAITLCN